MKTNYKWFRYYNPHPKLKEIGDCSIRALCVATGKSWIEVYDGMSAIGREIFENHGSMETIKEFLIREGFTPCTIRVKRGSRRPTMRDLIKKHPDTIIFGQCSSHVMCARDGKVMDTWDSSLRPLYKYWIKEQ